MDFVLMDAMKDYHYFVELEKEYIFQILVYNATNGRLKEKEVGNANIKFLEYPPTMQGSGGATEYIDFSMISNKTDKNGFYYAKFKIKNGGVGTYVINFEFGTCLGLPIPIKTEFNIK
jgi:hypothetical protein